MPRPADSAEPPLYFICCRIWNPDTGRQLLVLALAASGRLAVHARRFALSTGNDWAIVDIPAEFWP